MITKPDSDEMGARQFLIDCWGAGVASVKGENAVRQALTRHGPERVERLLAVGKAASSMCLGATGFMAPDAQCLMITKYGHTDPQLLEDQRFQVIESAHPIPDQNSIKAGTTAIDFVQSILPDQAFLVLVSGGASSLLEVLVEGLGLEYLESLTSAMLANGLDIHQINAVRTRISRIKGGKLMALGKSKSSHVLLVSDVQHDDPAVIGSGIGSTCPSRSSSPRIPAVIEEILADAGITTEEKYPCPSLSSFSSRVIASNTVARNACEQFATDKGLQVVMNEETLHGDMEDVVQRISELVLTGPSGVYVFGGEPTVVLPEKPGRGGRMQHLALSVAKSIRGQAGISLIAAGTDGTDGPTDAAGGIVDGTTYRTESVADTALVEADAGPYLDQVGGLFVSGPTGTNVMDLVIVLKNR